MFKDYVKAEAFDTKVLLEELLKYSKHYKAINDADSGNHRLDTVLRRLILLDMSVMNPFTLNLFEYRRCGEISDQQVIEALKSVETYLFRRWVCKVPTNALNKVFETLHSEVLRGVKDGGSYPDVLNKVLLSKEGSGHFPDDAEFMQAFEERTSTGSQATSTTSSIVLKTETASKGSTLLATFAMSLSALSTSCPRRFRQAGSRIWATTSQKSTQGG